MNSIVYIFFGSILFFIIAMACFVIWVIRKSTKPKSKEFIAKEQKKMHKKLMQVKQQLHPWEGHSALDITASMSYKRKKTFSNTLKGKVFSPQRNPVVAFSRIERGWAANGYMFATTTDFELFYDIRVDEFTIRFNNELLGEIAKSGDIFDAKGQLIGHAKHPTKLAIKGPFIDYKAGEDHFPLLMHGRHLATIKVAPNYGDGAVNAAFKNKLNQPLLTLHDENTTEEEEKWLLALSILEIAFHGHWLI